MLNSKQLKWVKSSMKEEKCDISSTSLSNNGVVPRLTDASMGSTTVSMCATALQATDTATTGGILTDKDCVTINHMRVKGNFSSGPIACTQAQASAVFNPSRARLLWVWFYKPDTQPSAAGTLPPITEVLDTDGVDGYPIAQAKNSEKFTILSDRMYYLGRALRITDASKGQDGPGEKTITFDYTVHINKNQHYYSANTSATLNGHFDSDSSKTGCVSRGLLVGYLLKSTCGGVAGTDGVNGQVTLSTRLNYSA